ncbi:MAG: FHA domain-containing protein [Bryobacteraceae bacterium]
MIQCNAGHFFDETKHSGCPYCGVPLDLGPRPTVPLSHGAGAAKTIPLRPQAAQPAAAAAGATRRLVQEQIGIDPVVGWLVCVEGPDRGRDFRIRSEVNFIGRDGNMDIAVTGDETISRQKHASLAFDPLNRAFWLMPGEGRSLCYVNDAMVTAAVQLKARDIIRMGKSKLMLVPMVDQEFSWQ